GAGRDERAWQRQVGGQLLLTVAFLVTTDDALIDIIDVEHRQTDRLIAAVGEGAVTIVIARIAFVGVVHGWFGRSRGGHLLLLKIAWSSFIYCCPPSVSFLRMFRARFSSISR